MHYLCCILKLQEWINCALERSLSVPMGEKRIKNKYLYTRALLGGNGQNMIWNVVAQVSLPNGSQSFVLRVYYWPFWKLCSECISDMCKERMMLQFIWRRIWNKLKRKTGSMSTFTWPGKKEDMGYNMWIRQDFIFARLTKFSACRLERRSEYHDELDVKHKKWHYAECFVSRESGLFFNGMS